MKQVSEHKNTKKIENSIEFEQVIERGCGIDVHRDTIVVTIQGQGIATTTKTYTTFTADLEEAKAWLKENKITHVAMESTGVYWKPVINVLGADFTILLVNARHIKNVPGHKTDKKDSKWLAKLLLSGLLKGSFIPPRLIRNLRDLTRYRSRLVGMLVSEKNRLIKILEDTNIKLSTVLSDPFCVSGRRILGVVIERADYEVEELVALIHRRVKVPKEVLVKALKGQVDGGHRYMLKTMLDHILELERRVKELDQEIKKVSDPYKKELELLQTIPGVGEKVAIGIIAEIGIDMGQFASHQHLSSWAGLSPGNNQSAGKNRSGRTNQGNKWLKTNLVEGAWSASHSKDTYLQSKFRSLVKKKGPKKAIIALGHKLLIAAYYIIKDKKVYKDLGNAYLGQFRKEKLINFYKHQLAKLETTSGILVGV